MKASGRHLKLALGLVLAALLLAGFFRGVDWGGLVKALRAADPLLLSVVVLSTVGVYLSRAWRWGYLLAPMGRVGFGRLFSATAVGFMTGLVIPRAGEVVRPLLVGRSHKIPISSAFASIILERLFDLITVLALFFLYLYVLPTPATQTQGPLLASVKFFGALAGFGSLVILAVLVAFHMHADRAMAWFDRLFSFLPARLARPLSLRLREFGGGLGVLQAPAGHLFVIAAQSVLVWLVIATQIYANNRAFGIDLPFHSTFLILGFLTVGVAVPTPGMVGGFHYAYLIALTQAYGISADVAAAAGIACHALTNIPVLLIGLVLLPREGLTLGQVAEMTEHEEDK